MKTDRKKILDHWNDDKVESMYDKYLISLEIDQIKEFLPENSQILDAGCGEGEGTLIYSEIPGVNIVAADFSETRLKKASEVLMNCNNVSLRRTDFLSEVDYPERFDAIITQRFLINLVNFTNQKNTIKKLISLLNEGGKLILLEGSLDGVEELNKVRKGYGLGAINPPWHNAFFRDKDLESFLKENGFNLEFKSGLGSYYLMTRAVRPIFDKNLNWDADFNEKTAALYKSGTLKIDCDYSRTRMWVFSK